MQERLTHPKERRRAELAVGKDDIVDLVSKAWDESFSHIAINQKAVAEWGWGSLNYNFFFFHPEIQLKTPQICKQKQTIINQSLPFSHLD